MFKSTLSYAIIASFITAASGLFSEIDAQFQDEDYRRFSVSAHGGLTLPNNESALRLFGSDFNKYTNQTYNIGGGAQYALTPYWSVGAEYGYTNIDGRALFNSEVHSVGVKNYFNFNRLYRRSSVSELLNPFASVGFGRDFFTYKSSDTRFSDNETYFKFGFGLALNVTETVEFFGQYDTHLASNKLDNIRTGTATDLIGKASGGVRIYLGKKNTRRLAMAPASVNLNYADYRDFRSRMDKLALLENESEQKDTEIDSLKREMQVLENNLNSEIDSLYHSSRNYTNKIDTLEAELAALRLEIEDAEVIRNEISAGHYVQVFATTNESIAQDVRRNTILLLRDVIENPESRVIIAHRRQFFEVLIGGYDRFSLANNIQKSVAADYNDAFVLTFARPYNLNQLYSDIRIVH